LTVEASEFPWIGTGAIRRCRQAVMGHYANHRAVRRADGRTAVVSRKIAKWGPIIKAAGQYAD